MTNVRTPRPSAFTLVEIMIVVALIGMLAVIAFPNFVKARSTSQMNACINNLRQIDSAMQQWALESKKPLDSSLSFADISTYLKSSVICPSGGTTFGDSYSISTLTNQPLCKQVPAGANAHIMPAETLN